MQVVGTYFPANVVFVPDFDVSTANIRTIFFVDDQDDRVNELLRKDNVNPLIIPTLVLAVCRGALFVCKRLASKYSVDCTIKRVFWVIASC